jgi:hypothetical protein
LHKGALFFGFSFEKIYNIDVVDLNEIIQWYKENLKWRLGSKVMEKMKIIQKLKIRHKIKIKENLKIMLKFKIRLKMK